MGKKSDPMGAQNLHEPVVMAPAVVELDEMELVAAVCSQPALLLV
jgi:hypothetical protein